MICYAHSDSKMPVNLIKAKWCYCIMITLYATAWSLLHNQEWHHFFLKDQSRVTPDRDILIKWHQHKKRNQVYTTDRVEAYIIVKYK